MARSTLSVMGAITVGCKVVTITDADAVVTPPATENTCETMGELREFVAVVSVCRRPMSTTRSPTVRRRFELANALTNAMSDSVRLLAAKKAAVTDRITVSSSSGVIAANATPSNSRATRVLKARCATQRTPVTQDNVLLVAWP